MSWAATEADFLRELAARPAARPPSTLGEIWDAEWNRAGLDTLVGVGKPYADAYDELTAAIETAGGKPVHELAAERGMSMAGAIGQEGRLRVLHGIADSFPDEQRKAIDPLRDVRRRAAEKAQAIERDAADVSGATYGLSGIATGFLAGIARQVVDPVNIATLPAGGPLKGPLLRVIGREAAIGAATQAVQEPYIEAGRAELGLEAGFTRGLVNTAEAAIGAAGIVGLFRGAAAAYRYAQGPGRAVQASGAVQTPEMRSEADFGPSRQVSAFPEAISRDLSPDDLDAAAKVAEREQLIDTELAGGGPPPGHVRFYHGSKGGDPTDGGGRWVAPDPKYARDFRRGENPNDVHYVDVPIGDPVEVAARAWDEIDEQGGTNMVGRYTNIELPEEWARKLTPLATADAAGRAVRAEQLEVRTAELETGRPAEGVAPRPDEYGGPGSLPPVVHVGPGGLRTTPISSRAVFHETSAESAAGLLVDDLTNNVSGVRSANIYVADNPDIAIGQGGKGIRIEFSGDLVSGVEHRKPGTGDLAGREYRTNAIGNNAIRSVLVAEGEELPLRDAWRARFDAEFEGIKQPDGSTLYRRREVPEAEITTTAVEARKPVGPAARDPATFSLLEFLASKGGLQPHPDLEVLFGGTNPFVPGFGKLFREKGLTLDRAREAVTEAKYIVDAGTMAGRQAETDINTLLEMIGKEARGNRQYIAGETRLAGRDDSGELAVRKAELADAFDERLRGLGVEPLPWDDVRLQRQWDRLRDRSLEIMAREGETDPLLAYERALLEHEDRLEARRRAREAEQIEIPGWDVPDDARAAPGDRGGAGEASAGRSGDGVPGRSAPEAGGGAGEARQVGNRAIALDAERALIEFGDNLEITIEMPDGTLRRGPARDLLAEVDQDAAAAAELIDCIGLELA